MSSNEMRSLSAWWHNAIFLYTSATVLIAASLRPSVIAEVQDSIYGSFYKANEILRQYTIFNPSTARLATALHILSSFIPKNYSRLKQSAKGQTGSTPEDAGDTATFQYCCLLGPNCIPAHDLKTQGNTGQNDTSHAHILSDLDLLFDPDDFSWLTRIPFKHLTLSKGNFCYELHALYNDGILSDALTMPTAKPECQVSSFGELLARARLLQSSFLEPADKNLVKEMQLDETSFIPRSDLKMRSPCSSKPLEFP